jgi:hypothetical protein
MFGKKSYNKGLEAGIKIRNDLEAQDVKALEAILREAKLIGENQTATREIVQNIIQELSDKEIEQLFGIEQDNSVENLEDEEKKVLLNVLVTLATEMGDSYNENQSVFLYNLKTYLGLKKYEENAEYNIELLENIDSQETRKLFGKVIAYFLFLENLDTEYYSRYEELYDALGLRKSERKKIDSGVLNTYRLYGIQAIIDMYDTSDCEDEGYDTEDEQEENNVIGTISESFDETHIESILNIRSGEVKQFQQEAIHISAYINCEGTLSFTDCEIYYNESEKADEIKLRDNAELYMKNCTIFCAGYDKNPFISGNASQIKIEFCDFLDCSEFCAAEVRDSLLFDNCHLHNCAKFLRSGSDNVLVSNNTIEVDEDMKEYNIGIGKRDNYIFYLDSGKLCGNNVIETSEYRNREMNSLLDKCSSIYNIHSFMFMSMPMPKQEEARRLRQLQERCRYDRKIKVQYFCAAYIEDNVFEGARYCISGDFGNATVVNNCEFTDCSDIVCNLEEGSSIKNSKFKNCMENLIYQSDGGIEVSNCEFFDIKNSCEDEEKIKSSSIYFEIDSSNTTVSRCTFENIEVNSAFLIGTVTSTSEKPKAIVIIEDCDFRNCSTKRESGKLIKTRDTYLYGLFDTVKECRTTQILNCRGLPDDRHGARPVWTATKPLNNL